MFDSRLFKKILDIIIYQKLKLWLDNLKGFYVEFNEIPLGEVGGYDSKLNDELPVGIDRLMLFGKTTYFY